MLMIQPDLTTATQGTREGYGRGICAAAEKYPQVMALCADLDESVRLQAFKKQFPERFVQVGVAEQNLAGVAAGLALSGAIPFAASFAAFNPGRNWDQIRTSICYSNLNVKVVGGHASLTVGEDGATHQVSEDLALMRTLPNMTVVVPCDALQAELATVALAEHRGPSYLRLSRVNCPDITTGLDFELGKAQILRPGMDLTIFAIGNMVALALRAAQTLQIQNIQAQVINLHTIKPLDVHAIVTAANQSGVFVTAEEHQVAGGLGSAIAEVVTTHLGKTIQQPTVLEMVGIQDSFGESGTATAIMEKHGLTADAIVGAALKALHRKGQLR